MKIVFATRSGNALGDAYLDAPPRVGDLVRIGPKLLSRQVTQVTWVVAIVPAVMVELGPEIPE